MRQSLKSSTAHHTRPGSGIAAAKDELGLHGIDTPAIEADIANVYSVTALDQHIAAGVGVGVSQCSLDLAECDSIAAKAFGIGVNFITLHGSAGARHIDNAIDPA